MRDYVMLDDEGPQDRGVFVADLPDDVLHELLRDGFTPLGAEPVNAIRERLELEVFIRTHGLRAIKED